MGLEVGIGLRDGPDHEKSMGRIDLCHQAVLLPFLEYPPLFLDPTPKFTAQMIANDGSSADDFHRKKARGFGMVPGQSQFSIDVLADGLFGVAVYCNVAQGFEPQTEHLFDNDPVKGLF